MKAAVLVVLSLCLVGGVPVQEPKSISGPQIVPVDPDGRGRVSCDECWRMLEAMNDFCQDNGHTLDTKPYITKCIDYITPVSRYDYATKENKCSLFEMFARRTYCPRDPCTQITRVISHTPNALCRMMECVDPTSGGHTADKSPAFVPAVPLRCDQYFEKIVNSCQAELARRQTLPDVHGLPLPSSLVCNEFPTNFQREGCEAVLARAHETHDAVELCETLTCKNESPAEFCERVGFPSQEIVPVREYFDYLQHYVNKTDPVLDQPFGIRFLHATLGYKCQAEGLTVKDNILEFAQLHCEGHRICELPHPNATGAAKSIKEAGCDLNFELNYQCSPTGVVHNVYGPSDAVYTHLRIDCSAEQPKFSPIDPDHRPDLFNEQMRKLYDHIETTVVDERK